MPSLESVLLDPHHEISTEVSGGKERDLVRPGESRTALTCRKYPNLRQNGDQTAAFSSFQPVKERKRTAHVLHLFLFQGAVSLRENHGCIWATALISSCCITAIRTDPAARLAEEIATIPAIKNISWHTEGYKCKKRFLRLTEAARREVAQKHVPQSTGFYCRINPC